MSQFPHCAEISTHFSNLDPARRRAPRILAVALLAVVLACSGSVESRMTEIRSLQEAGQFDPSIAPLRLVLTDEPDNAEANYRLGIALVQTGRPSLAVWPLQKAAASESHAVPAGLLLASTMMQNGTFEESIRAADRVLEIEPENTTALYTRAMAHLSAGQPEGTLADADAILALKPGDVNATSLRGGALIDLNRVDEAEELWLSLYERSKASGDEKDAARKCAAIATFYRSQKDNEKAGEQFAACLGEYPSNPLIQQWVADFYIETGQPEKAINVWRAAVEATPEDLSLRGKLADLLTNEEHREEGEQFLLETVELFDTPPAWAMLSSFYRSLGEPKQAREALESAMERSGQASSSLRFAQADMLIEEGELDRAEEIAATIEEPSYRNLLDGSILLARGEPEAALAKLESGLRLWPNNAGARYLAGQCALQLGDYERAITEFREAVRVGETETDASLRLAEIYFTRGNYVSAAQFAQRHINKRPFVDDRAHVIAARSHIALRQWEAAEGVLQNLKARQPQSSVPYVEFAALKRAQDGPQAAIDMMRKAPIDLEEAQHVEALRALTTDLLAVDRGDEALALVAAAAARNPDSAANIELHARLLAAMGRNDEARAKLEALIAAHPEHAPAFEALGSLARSTGQLDEAVAYFDRAAAISTDVPDYDYAAAQILLMQGQTDAAIERLREARAIDPGHLGANNDLAFLIAQRGGDLDEALNLAQRAVRIDRSAETLDTLGYVYLKRGDAEQAIDVLSRALEEQPDSPSIEYRLGMARSANGDKAGAREMITKALGSSVAFPEAEEARAALARLQES
jgi:tetratricopeptide (TPR) repeat protein